MERERENEVKVRIESKESLAKQAQLVNNVKTMAKKTSASAGIIKPKPIERGESELKREETEELKLAEFKKRLKKAHVEFDAKECKFYRFDVAGRYELNLGEEAKAFLEVLKENPRINWEKHRDSFEHRIPPAILSLTAEKLGLKLKRGGWTDLHSTIIRQLYCEGLSTINLSSLFGVYPYAVNRWMRRYGIGRRSVAKIPGRLDLDKRIAVAYKEKESVGIIAKELGIPYKLVRRRLIALGLHKPISVPKHLSPSERAVFIKHGEIPEVPKELTVETACLAFAMLADFKGTIDGKGRYALGLSAGESRDFAEKFASLANKAFNVHYIEAKPDGGGWSVRFSYKPLWEWYRKYFAFGKYDWEIKPETMEWLRQLDSKELGRILSWYFEGDGGVHGLGQFYFVSVASVNEKGLSRIRELVESLGIRTRLGGPYVQESANTRPYYRLYIAGKKNAQRYAKIIGFVSKKKIKSLMLRLASSPGSLAGRG